MKGNISVSYKACRTLKHKIYTYMGKLILSSPFWAEQLSVHFNARTLPYTYKHLFFTMYKCTCAVCSSNTERSHCSKLYHNVPIGGRMGIHETQETLTWTSSWDKRSRTFWVVSLISNSVMTSQLPFWSLTGIEKIIPSGMQNWPEEEREKNDKTCYFWLHSHQCQH